MRCFRSPAASPVGTCPPFFFSSHLIDALSRGSLREPRSPKKPQEASRPALSLETGAANEQVPTVQYRTVQSVQYRPACIAIRPAPHVCSRFFSPPDSSKVPPNQLTVPYLTFWRGRYIHQYIMGLDLTLPGWEIEVPISPSPSSVRGDMHNFSVEQLFLP